MTELRIQKPQLFKNWNFSENNDIINDGILSVVWSLPSEWNISNGKAICTSSLNNALAYNNAFYKSKYKIIISIATMSVGAVITVNIGSNSQVINSTGVHEIILDSGNSFDFNLFVDTGYNASINWIKCYEVPSVEYLDIQSDIDIPITYNIADIRDPSKRNGNYSKTIQLDGTHTNNRIFNQIFEIAGDGTFNPNKKSRATLYSNGVEVLDGFLQLKEIVRVNNGVSNYDAVKYNVILNSGVTDIFQDLSTKNLRDLNFSEYNHIYNIGFQRASWDLLVMRNNIPTGNFNLGYNKLITSVQLNGDGKTILNFSTPHTFVNGDHILIDNTTSGSKGYEGNHKVHSIISPTSCTIYFPYIPASTLNAQCKIHEAFGFGYVYPMIKYGSSTTSNYGKNWNATDFIPSLYVKEIIDKIFKLSGYNYVSNFFESKDFRRLLLSSAVKDFKASAKQLNNRAFQATTTVDITGTTTYTVNSLVDPYASPLQVGYKNTSTSTNRNVYPMFNDDSTPPNFDNSNTFNPATGRWTPNVTAKYKIGTNIIYHQHYTLPPNYYLDNLSVVPLALQSVIITVQVLDFTNSTSKFSYQYAYDIRQSNNFTVTKNIISTEIIFEAGHEYGIEVNIKDADTFALKTVGSPALPLINNWGIKTNSSFYNIPVDTPYVEGDTVDVTTILPNILCKDFLINIFKMFNLYIEPLGGKTLLIEPRDDYYLNGSTKVWTNKLDVDEPLIIQPMAELGSKKYSYLFKQDAAKLNVDHLKLAGFGYGDFSKTIENEFVTNENKTELIFASGVLEEFPIGSNRVITGIYNEEGGVSKRMDSLPRILYFGIASSAGSADPNVNYISVDPLLTKNNETTYCYAGHLDKVRAPNLDYNFHYPYQTYFTSDSWTNGNLYNRFYRNTVTELTSKNNKLITAAIYLKNRDINELSFKDTYIINGHHLRLNKIIDFIPSTSTSTRCEFTKIENSLMFKPLYRVGYGSDLLDGYVTPISSEPLPSISIKNYGANNIINGIGSNHITADGDNNNIGSFCNDVTIIGNNNTVQSGLSNVSIVNTNNVYVTESNVSIINGVVINESGGIYNNNINLIDAGVNIVLTPFNKACNVNLVDGGKNTVLNIGSNNIVNHVSL